MLDSKNNRRFFLTDSMDNVIDLAKGKISNKQSPCVVMESTVEGGGPILRPNRNYPIFFFVKAAKMNDGDEAAVAKEEAWEHARNFLAWLLDKRKKEVAESRDGDFARIVLDDASLDIQTVGPLENGWFAVMLQIEREEPLNLCVDDNLYVQCECECDETTE
jgi:hypothetical protein